MKKWVGLIAVFLLAIVARPATVVAQGSGTVDTPTIEGAHDLILIPANWNGSLFIYAHGYTADERLLEPFPPDITLGNALGKLPLLLQASVLPTLEGYAS